MKQLSVKSGIFIAIIIMAIIGILYVVLIAEKKGIKGTEIGKVNGKAIYKEEVIRQLQSIQGGQGVKYDDLKPEAKHALIREVAAHKLLLDEAKKEGIARDKEVKEQVDNYREQVIKQVWLARIGEKAIKEENIRTRYDALIKDLQGKDEYKLRHILVKTRGEADAVLNELKTTPFEALAKGKSIDPGSASRGGDLGYVMEGQMVKPFEKVAFSLKKGELSEPVETSFGWHIIKMEGRRPAKAATFEVAKPRIAQQLLTEAMNAHMEGLLEKAAVTFND